LGGVWVSAGPKFTTAKQWVLYCCDPLLWLFGFGGFWCRWVETPSEHVIPFAKTLVIKPCTKTKTMFGLNKPSYPYLNIFNL
jgi:hypothetical protein